MEEASPSRYKSHPEIKLPYNRNKPTYVHEHFERHGKVKPKYVILVYEYFTKALARDNLIRKMRNGGTAPIDVNSYLFFSSTNYAHICTEVWHSFGVTICDKNERVHPITVIDFSTRLGSTRDIRATLPKSIHEIIGSDADDHWLLIAALAHYKISKFKKEYPQLVSLINAVRNLMRKYNCLNPELYTWYNLQLFADHDGFAALTSAYDMFFHKFKTGKLFPDARFCTEEARYTDSHVFTLKLEVKVVDDAAPNFSLWINSIEPIRKEFDVLRKYDLEDEIYESDSYFPYSSGFKLCYNSIYDKRNNPHFHLWVSIICAMMFEMNGLNAVVDDIYTAEKKEVTEMAILVSYIMFRSLVPSDQAMKISQEKLKTFPEPLGNDPVNWITWYKSCKEVPPQMKYMLKRFQDLDCRVYRAGTVAHYLQTYEL